MLNTLKCSTISNLVPKLLDSISDKRPTFTVTNLKTLRSRLKDDELLAFDFAISSAVQLDFKVHPPRFGVHLKITQRDLDDLQVVFSSILKGELDTTMYYKLPYSLQLYLKMCSSNKVYGCTTTQLKSVVPVVTQLNKTTENRCKRCYASTESTLCDSCKQKIESCTEFINESFSTSGTTIEAFQYTFKDWSVTVNNWGEYSFVKGTASTEEYQPNLTIKEYQKFSVLLG